MNIEYKKNKVSDHEISRLNYVLFALRALFTPVVTLAVLDVIICVIYHFFFLQFQTKFRLKKRKVVDISHPLDDLIAFDYSFSKKYLSFISLWISSLYFIKKHSNKNSWNDIKVFLKKISHLYRECASVYDLCQSTTPRPVKDLTFTMKFIHTLDPHLHCFPSLHVLIVFVNYFEISKLIDKYIEDDLYALETKKYLYDEALLITESILYVKQHSVNCVGASLFALRKICPDVTGENVKNIIHDIFIYNGDGCDDIEKIQSYIYNLYLDFEQKYDKGKYNDYKDLLLEFLGNYNKLSFKLIDKTLIKN